MQSDDQLPDVAAVLAAVLQSVPAAQRPLMIALAERLAAARYRGWAKQVEDGPQRAGLLACAQREVEIAQRVETLYPQARAQQESMRSAHPALDEINDSLFSGRPLPQQFALQAQGERLGAATWRSLARAATTPDVADVFLACAPLEEANALFLDSLRQAALA